MEADIKDECPVQTGKGNNANLKTNKKTGALQPQVFSTPKATRKFAHISTQTQ